MVIDTDGKVERFGYETVYGTEMRIHRPVMYKRSEVERFARAVLRPGVFVSNGYRSFSNGISSKRNGEVRRAFIHCVDRATSD